MNKKRKAVWVALVVGSLVAMVGPSTASASFQAGEVGDYLQGGPTGQVVLSVQGLEVACAAELAGETSATEANTQDLHPALDCYSSGWGTFHGRTEGCEYRLDPNEEATLHSCKNGGIELNADINLYSHCHVFIPNQTVPVSYANGSEESPFQVDFTESVFDGEVTESKLACPMSKTESTPVQISGNYEVFAASGFWFDPEKTLPFEFHTAASATIEGTPSEGLTTFVIDGSENVSCQIGNLAGEYPAAEDSETLSGLEVNPATGICSSSWWSQGVSVDQTGCSYSFHADGTADLESCNNGNMVLTWKIPFIVRCKVAVPNQSGASDITYRNHGADGDVGVLATVDLGFTGEVTEASGACPYAKGESVSVTQEGAINLLSNEGASELWFG